MISVHSCAVIVSFLADLYVFVYWRTWVTKKRDESNQRVETNDPSFKHVVVGSIVCTTAPIIIALLDSKHGFVEFSPLMRSFGSVLSLSIPFLLYATLAHLSENWMPTISKLQNQRLVTTGPYAIIRHPMYTCAMIGPLGMFLASGNLGFLVTILGGIILSIYRCPREDALLQEMFGKPHTEWKSRTWNVIPFLW